jgi:WD domain, G-beta repeat
MDQRDQSNTSPLIQQIEQLQLENDYLTNEVLRLEKELAQFKSSSREVSERSGQSTVSDRSSKSGILVPSIPFYTEGDGRWIDFFCSKYSPNNSTVNILSVSALQGKIGESLLDSLFIFSSTANNQLVITRYDVQTCESSFVTSVKSQAPILSLCVDQSSHVCYAACMNGAVEVYEFSFLSNENVMEINKKTEFLYHNKFVTCISLSACGKYLATCSSDGSVCIVDSKECKKIQQIFFDSHIPSCITWFESTLIIATKSSPYLHYLTLVNEKRGSDGVSSDLPSLPNLESLSISIAQPQFHLNNSKKLSTFDPGLFLYHQRVPLSEDGGLTSIYKQHKFQDEDYIPVGFSVDDISISSGNIGASSDSPILALAGDNGTIYLFKFGSNEILRRFAGHIPPSASSVVNHRTRIKWQPSSPYLAVTSEKESAILFFSLASQTVVKKFFDCGSVKDLIFLPCNTKSSESIYLITCGFDKLVKVFSN